MSSTFSKFIFYYSDGHLHQFSFIRFQNYVPWQIKIGGTVEINYFTTLSCNVSLHFCLINCLLVLSTAKWQMETSSAFDMSIYFRCTHRWFCICLYPKVPVRCFVARCFGICCAFIILCFKENSLKR